MGPRPGYANTVRTDRQPGWRHRHNTAQKASKILKTTTFLLVFLKIINVYNVTVGKRRRKRKRKWEPDGQPAPLARGRQQQARSASGTRRSRRKRKGNERQRRQLMSSLLEVCRLWLVLVGQCRRNRGTDFLFIILAHLLLSILFR
jgi:hypothetical protein